MKKSILIVSLVLSQSVLMAANSKNATPEGPGFFAKIAGEIVQSKPICWCNQKLSFVENYVENYLEDTPAASAKYRALGQEAQAAVGVPGSRILPIKKPNPLLLKFQQEAIGCLTSARSICINEARFNTQSFGRQRALLFCAACQVKYNDVVSASLVRWAALLLGGVLTHKVIKAVKPVGKYKFLHGLGVLAGAITAGSASEMTYGKFIDRRAALEAHYALQCATCVKESATDVQKKLIKANDLESATAVQKLINNLTSHTCYDLSPLELGLIADDLERQNKKCVYHQFTSDNIVTEK